MPEASMKVIIGVDESGCSEAAVAWVKKMPWPRDTRIVVLSVARPAVGAYAEVYAPQAPYMEQVMEEQVRHHQELSSRAERQLREAGFATEARIAEGDPRIALVDTARTERADMVVVGSHGRTGITKLLLGSVAHHVVTHAPCTVVVVKSGDNGARGPS
jgi:nucleotide-binding universal stress UspA family protein